MSLLLCSLCKFVENAIIEVAVVVKFIVFVYLLDSHAKLDDHVLVQDEFLDRLREDVDCLKV